MALLKRKPHERPPQQPSPQVARQERQEREQKEKLVEGVRRGWWRKVDVAKLTLDEASELRDLSRKARGEGPYPVADLSLLGPKERKRVWALLDKCLPDAERERARKVERLRAERELENLAVATLSAGVPPRLRAGVQHGEAVLPREAVEIGTLNVADLGVLAVVLYAFSSGTAGVFKDGRFDESGALLLSKKAELANRELLVDFKADGTVQHVANVDATLAHLDRNGFLDAKRDGHGWTIRPGERLPGWSR